MAIDFDALEEEKRKLQIRITEINIILKSNPKDVLGREKPKTHYLYAIKCKDGHYYIGHTTNVPRRFIQHLKGKGSWFTREHQPLEVKESFSIGQTTTAQAASAENDLALRYLLAFGIDKVRGGHFIQKDPKYFKHLMKKQ